MTFDTTAVSRFLKTMHMSECRVGRKTASFDAKGPFILESRDSCCTLGIPGGDKYKKQKNKNFDVKEKHEAQERLCRCSFTSTRNTSSKHRRPHALSTSFSTKTRWTYIQNDTEQCRKTRVSLKNKSSKAPSLQKKKSRIS